MDYVTYLNQILETVDSIKQEDELHARLKNAIRIYYLEINQIFITERILKNINFSGVSLSSSEIQHFKNAGWVLDKKYLDDVYLSSIKTHFLFNVWYTLRSFDENNKYKELKNNLGVLIDAMGRKFILTGIFKFNGIKKNTGELVDFVTPDFILDIAKQFAK